MSALSFVACGNYQIVSAQASEKMVNVVTQKPAAVICLATGATPLLTYQKFIAKVSQRGIDVSQVTFVKLDEWLGPALTFAGSSETFLRQQVFTPLSIADSQVISFQSQNIDARECQRVTALIAAKGGLDLCLLGLGKNGHLGLNEPADALEPCCHIATLEEQTKHHEMLNAVQQRPEQGITLGLQDILAAREILFLVAGEGKQRAFNQMRAGKVSTRNPSSFLWLHHNVTCLYDASRY